MYVLGAIILFKLFFFLENADEYVGFLCPKARGKAT